LGIARSRGSMSSPVQHSLATELPTFSVLAGFGPQWPVLKMQWPELNFCSKIG
jgi:hypothetical protein